MRAGRVRSIDMESAPVLPPSPSVPDAAPPRRLDPRVVRLWRTSGLIWTVVLAAALLGIDYLLAEDLPVWVGALAILLYGAFYILFWVPRAYAAWEFEIRDTDVRLRRGVFWKRTSVVPHARIQHVDTRHGPLTRAYGLSSVVLYTAGHTGAAIEIPGLPSDEAESLRERLGALSGADDAV